MRRLIALLVSLILPFAHASSLPSWVTAPPGDSLNWFYSVGAGDNEQHARNQALEALSTRLQVTIQTETQQFVEAKDGNTQLYLETDSLLSSSGLTFTNIEILKTAHYNNDIVLLVKVDRQAFFQQIHNQLKNTLADFLVPNMPEQLSSALVKIIQYQQSKTNLERKMYLLDAYAFNTQALKTLSAKLQQRASKLAELISYRVILANINQSGVEQIHQSITQHMQSIGFTSNAKSHQLKVVFAGVNIQQTETPFHSAVKLSAQLHYLLDDQLIYQYPLKATAYNQNAQMAKQQALILLQAQLEGSS